MTGSWQEAISRAESALAGGSAGAAGLTIALDGLRADPRALFAPAAGKHFAYLTALLDALGLGDASSALVDQVSARALGDPELRDLDSAVRNQLAVTLANRGKLAAASVLLSFDHAPGSRARTGVAAARTLANLAAVKMRKGDHEEAVPAARHALDMVSDEEGTEALLNVRLLALTVLVEGVRQQGSTAEADELLGPLEQVVRQLVRLLGEGHPRSLAAVVALASAEFESARSAGARDRMERAADVLAVVAQKTSATLGTRHPQSLSSLRTLAGTEFEAAQVLGPVRRIGDARSVVRAASGPGGGAVPAEDVRPAGAARPAGTQERSGNLAGEPPARIAERRTPPWSGPGPAPRTATPTIRPWTVPKVEPWAAPVLVPGPAVRRPAQEHPRVPERHEQDTETVRFSVLGPVRAWRDGESLATGSPQQRALLSALLLRDGRVATAAELIEAIWGDDPPSQALAAVRTYASRLRKMFPPGLLASVSGGYAIRVNSPVDALDLTTAEYLAAEAEKVRTAGDLDSAKRLLDRALSLWHGEPLAGVPGPYAETQRARLTEWQLQLREQRLDMELDLGGHVEAVSELTALTAAHPLRERLRELLMLALYRAGRQAEALAVYADTRRLLAAELGVEPRPELRILQRRILTADATLKGPASPPSHVAPVTVRPEQLPATVPDFTGKSAHVGELLEVLSAAESRGLTVAAIAGIGGAGKTTLAVHVAHQARALFPGGQLYVDLQGVGERAADPETVLGAFLRALGTPDQGVPDTLEERQALYRSVLADRRILVVLDNARDVAQVRPLLPGSGGCAALITSRGRMVDLPAAHLVDLDVMSPDEALLLFTRIVGAERVTPERHAALDVVAACGFLPLAIRIAASRLAARRTWTVSTLAAKLADKRRRLDELQAGDLAVKATFELDYGALEAQQARAFRLLGLAEGPDISLSAAAAMLDQPVEATEDLLESLVDTSLLESAAPGRYRYHDLVRLYARACAERDEQPPRERADSLSRLMDFYLMTASGAYALTRPGDTAVSYLQPGRTEGLRFDTAASARRWLHAESDCVLACVQQSLPTDSARRGVDLLLAARELADSGANPGLYESVAEAACAAAREGDDPWAEARARTALAGVLLLAGRLEQADGEARRAVRLAERTGDPLPHCLAVHDLGVIAMFQGRHADGERYLAEAVSSFRTLRNLPGEADALGNLSRIRLSLGKPASAVDLARRSLDIHDRTGRTERVAGAHYVLGLALTKSEQFDDAVFQLSSALRAFRQQGNRIWEGQTLYRLAEAHLATGRFADAASDAELALSLLTDSERTRHRAGVLTVLGSALHGIGHTDRARACWEEVLSLLDRTGSAGTAETDELRRRAARYLHGAGTRHRPGGREGA